MNSPQSDELWNDDPPDLTIDRFDDPRLLAITREYMDELEAGGSPDVEDYVARHPELAESVRSCLDGLELIHRSMKRDRSRVIPEFDPSPSLTAEPLGDFRIVRELGRGGMGVVYEAVQSSLGRRVALKVLPFAATLQPRHLQRFLNEAQAAAHLHHSHIVPVFAVGCDRGVHYYAMQLIEGLSLAELLTKLRRDSGWVPVSQGYAPTVVPGRVEPAPEEPSRPVSPLQSTLDHFSSRLSTEHASGRFDYFRTVARFALQAAEALSYAHELGIVHRDIKPANLMLDARGKVWVTDFGLAQVRSGADLTQTGDLLGTLRYMSPEQVQGDRALVDQRTDIYSLGATLYELVTLQQMFAGSNRESLLHQVLQEDPPAPRKLNKAVPVELETIICKAISKSPFDRYSTAQQFADDLQRFLSHQPILAQRPTLVTHARKWARRHPTALACTLLVLLAMSVGLFIHNRMIAAEQQRTQSALLSEQVRALEAEQSFQQARQAVDLLIQIGEEELGDKPNLQTARKRLLVAALAYYQGFIANNKGDAESQQELAAVQDRVKGILNELLTVHAFFQTRLTAEPDVQADLQVTATQREQLEAFHREVESEIRGIMQGGPPSDDGQKQRFVTFARTQTARLAGILTEPQQTRLKQISLQSQGLVAFQEPEIVQTLQLTAEQRKAIREIEFQAVFGRGPKPPDGPPPPGFRGRPRRHEDDEREMRAAVQRVLALLTPEQQSRWQELTGLPFQGRLLHFPPGGPPGPPGDGPPFHDGPPPRSRFKEPGPDDRGRPSSEFN